MPIERFFVPGLAHVSYVVASGREAVVVDPARNVEGYLAYLAKNGLELRYIFLTHPHADFVAGHAELSARSGAPILVSENAPATFPHGDLKDGDRITVGTVQIKVMATPGHSPGGMHAIRHAGKHSKGLPRSRPQPIFGTERRQELKNSKSCFCSLDILPRPKGELEFGQFLAPSFGIQRQRRDIKIA
jgi:hypothetical protein